MRTPGQIFELYKERKKRLTPFHARALEIRNIVAGEFVVPLAELDKAERNANANMVLLGLEQTAMRTSSTMPMPYWPSVARWGVAGDERARTRRDINLYWWEKTALNLKMMKRARHLHGYSMAPVLLLPDFETKCPQWNVRDPLTTFPAEMQVGNMLPDDCLFVTSRPFGWLARKYPNEMTRLAKKNESTDAQYEVIEYVDDEEFVMFVVGKQPEQSGAWGPSVASLQGEPFAELERIVNRTRMPLAVVPGRISLDEPQGQFDGLIGMFQQQAMLMALELHGMKKAVFPETWAVSPVAGEPATIVTVADPVKGIIGSVEGGSIVQNRIEPSALGTQFVDRMERNQRVQGMVPAEFGGESASNIRTGRRGGQVLGETVDFQIQAAHLIFEKSLEVENKIAVAIEKKYFGGSRTVTTKVRGDISYKTDEVWETDENTVKYSQAGGDINDVTIAAGQMVGIGAMSRKTLMETHPLIPDADKEADQIVIENLETALLGGLQQMAASDPTFVEPMAMILTKVKANKMDLTQAYREVQEELQAKQQQAQEGELPPEQAQPGIADPQASIPEQPQGLANMDQLLQSLRGTTRGAGV
jgi:hypothetical protein